MKRSISVLALLAACALTGCASRQLPPPSAWEDGSSASDASASSQMSVRETPNISYIGVLTIAAQDGSMQGTHKLVLSDGRVIQLESANIDLDRYVSKNVTVFGASRPTTGDDGIIMRVEEVLMMEDEHSSSVSVSSEYSSSANASLFSSLASSVLPHSSSVATASSTALSVSSSNSSSMSEDVAVSSSSQGLSTEVMAHAAAMAKDNLSDANWTQKYCTSHIGFCIPIHRNWWFKSFGTTSTSLWHIEVSNAEIDALGSGPVIVKLLTGTVAAKHATDGQVRIQDDTAIGFHSWDGNEHFEVIAPANLQAIVSYIVAHLSATPTDQ